MDGVHDVIQEEHCPELTVSIQNIGSSPARNTRIEMRASKNIGLTAPITELRECGLIPAMERPRPPDQPQFGLAYLLGQQTALSSMMLPRFNAAQDFRNQEDFEYDSDVKLEIEQSVVFSCGLWHHSLEPREFTVRLVPEEFSSPVTGEITCTVHAENLTKPATFKFIVTLSPDYRSALEPAFGWFTTPHPDE